MMHSNSVRRILIAPLVVTLAAAGVLVGGVQSASAADDVSIVFVDASPDPVEFGQQWSLALNLKAVYEDLTFPLGESDGHVEVKVSGIGGNFANDVTIHDGGVAFISQPDDQPLLAAGDYTFTATFKPAGGTYYHSATTKKTAKLTITAVDLEPTATLSSSPTAFESAVITAGFSDAFLASHAGPPAGTWHFTVTSSAGESVYDSDVAQQAGVAEPLTFELPATLDKGAGYTLQSTFTVAGDFSGGYTIAPIAPSSITVPDSQVAGLFGASIPMPLWLIILLIVIIAGLAIAAILLGTRLPSRRARVVAEEPFVDEVELMSLDEVGLVPVDTMQIPAGQPWLLSDYDASVGTPTTVIPNTDSADVPTELMSTDDVATQRHDVQDTPETADPEHDKRPED
jgi:hypothetical protein